MGPIERISPQAIKATFIDFELRMRDCRVSKESSGYSSISLDGEVRPLE